MWRAIISGHGSVDRAQLVQQQDAELSMIGQLPNSGRGPERLLASYCRCARDARESEQSGRRASLSYAA